VTSRPTRVLVLDVDGCLLDSAEPVRRSLDVALAAHGRPPLAADELAALIGPPLRHGLTHHLARTGGDPTLVEALVRDYRDVYVAASVALARSYPGVPEAVHALAATTRLAVCTSKPRVYAVPILDALGLTPLFEFIEGPDTTETETKGDTLARLLAALGPTLDVRASVMVGDRRHDVEAAHEHGLTAVGVSWGYGSRAELEAAGADRILDRPAELLELATPPR